LVHFLKSQAKVQAPVKKKKNSQANILKKKIGFKKRKKRLRA
jgi:hypothetical protein